MINYVKICIREVGVLAAKAAKEVGSYVCTRLFKMIYRPTRIHQECFKDISQVS